MSIDITHPHFVPRDSLGSSQATARVLVDAATEARINQHEIRTVNGGFRISDAVYDALGWGGEPDPDLDPDTEPDPNAEPEGFTVSTESARTSGADPVSQPGSTLVEAGDPEYVKSETPDADANSALTSEPDPVNPEPEADEDDEDFVPPYSEWDRADLLAAVSARGIETSDKKNATLIAALEADDLLADSDED